MLAWFPTGNVLAALRVMAWGMAGILATTAAMMLVTMALRRAFPAPPEPRKEERSTER